MWATDCVVALTPGFAITIPKTANEFAIKEIRAFSQHENESLTDAWLRMKEMLQTAMVIICPMVILSKSCIMVSAKSGKSYNPPENPDEEQNKTKNPINFDSDDEDDEPIPQPKIQTQKPAKETLLPKPYKTKITIAENMLVEVGKFTFPVDFVILEMEEDSKVPLILGRPFLHTADEFIRVKQKQLNLGVGTE
ncbi:reverse transcriptase domain-containing protein [Tanacetum coccineum]